MALKLNEKYPGYMNAPSVDYPQGSFKNRTSPTSEDGSYFEQDWANDIQGFTQSLIQSAGVTPNGNVDKVGASQYFEALKRVISNESPSPSQATESVAGIAKVATLAESDAGLSDQVFITPKKTRPYLSGNATLTGSNNNIALTGIVSSLGLERGDVIRVVAGSYNKLHSVEILTNSDNVVVNYEHCGARGNGSLKLPNYTGVVTITRISKWYASSYGIGQEPVDLKAFRSIGVASQNLTGKYMGVYSTTNSSGSQVDISIDGVTWINCGKDGSETSPQFVDVPPSWYYRTSNGVSIQTRLEVR